MGGGRRSLFLCIFHGPSVACTVGCTWLMYSLCVAHIWPMYDLYSRIFIYAKFSIFTSTPVFEHAHMCSKLWDGHVLQVSHATLQQIVQKAASNKNTEIPKNRIDSEHHFPTQRDLLCAER